MLGLIDYDRCMYIFIMIFLAIDQLKEIALLFREKPIYLESTTRVLAANCFTSSIFFLPLMKMFNTSIYRCNHLNIILGEQRVNYVYILEELYSCILQKFSRICVLQFEISSFAYFFPDRLS